MLFSVTSAPQNATSYGRSRSMNSEPLRDDQPVDQSDVALALRAQAGDQEAFAALLERHWSTGARLARRVIKNREEVADILQESALAAYLNLGTLASADRFAGWFCGIVLNHCRMHLRRAHRSPPTHPLEATTVAAGFDVQATVEEGALLAQVTAAVRLLPEAQRQAALLVYFEGLSLNEAAGALEISATALKVRLHRARQALRSQFAVSPSRARPEKKRRRRFTMVEVEVFDVLLHRNTAKDGHEVTSTVIVLREKGGDRVLPVWVGEPEATSIALALEGVETARPMAYHFTAALLEAVGAEVKSVTISRLVKDTFYATASVQRGRTLEQVDARPSDAINLALRTGAPIFAEERVLSKAGKRARVTKAERTGAAALLELQEEHRQAPAKVTREEIEQAHQAWREMGLELLDD